MRTFWLVHEAATEYMQWFEGHAEALTKLGICTFPKCLLAMLGADTLLAQSQSNAFPSQWFRSMLEFLWLNQEFNGGYSPGSPWSSPGVECAVHWDPGRFPAVATAGKHSGVVGLVCALLSLCKGQGGWRCCSCGAASLSCVWSSGTK